MMLRTEQPEDLLTSTASSFVSKHIKKNNISPVWLESWDFFHQTPNKLSTLISYTPSDIFRNVSYD
jgi:hypothetical protein